MTKVSERLSFILRLGGKGRWMEGWRDDGDGGKDGNGKVCGMVRVIIETGSSSPPNRSGERRVWSAAAKASESTWGQSWQSGRAAERQSDN